jgi:(p)ppGpp synthase/HD superfamily hydrolase
MTHGYSDRIAHALSFAAKHGTPRSGPGAGVPYLTHPANVAVILARYACDEATIVAGILAVLLGDTEPPRRALLEAKIAPKFGERTLQVARAATEPRWDARGKERTWEVYKLEFLAQLAEAETRTLEICCASEVHLCGVLLTDVRRLGPEYLSVYAPGGAPTVFRWLRNLIEVLERHPMGPRPAMLAELRDLTGRLQAALDG